MAFWSDSFVRAIPTFSLHDVSELLRMSSTDCLPLIESNLTIFFRARPSASSKPFVGLHLQSLDLVKVVADGVGAGRSNRRPAHLSAFRTQTVGTVIR